MSADPVAWRVERYAEMGWSKTECHVLAHTKDDKDCPLYWGDVKRMLEDAKGNFALVYDICVGLAPAVIEYEEVGPLGGSDDGA